jgi:hypothetical protein
MIHASRHFFSILTSNHVACWSAQNGQTAIKIRFFFRRTPVVVIYDRFDRLTAGITNSQLSERLFWDSPQVMLCR